MRQRLANDGYYEMTDIGVLEMNEDGNIIFTPCEAGILTPELYGLSSFEMQPLMAEESTTSASSTQVQKPNVEPTPITTTVFDQVGQKEETSANDAGQDTDTDEDAEKTICIKVSWLRNAGIAAAAALLLFFVIFPISHSGLKNVNIGDFNGTAQLSVGCKRRQRKRRLNVNYRKTLFLPVLLQLQ